jgi:hypothetical protein
LWQGNGWVKRERSEAESREKWTVAKKIIFSSPDAFLQSCTRGGIEISAKS